MIRDNYFSLMKGIAIVAVLFIHTPFMHDGTSAIAVRQMFTFAVSMFFFLSGYFAKDAPLRCQGLLRLLVPYLIWSVLWFLETLLSGAKTVTFWNVMNAICFGGAFFPLYFLIVSVELKIVTPLIFSKLNRGGYLWYKDWLLLVTPLTLAVIYTISCHTKQLPAVYAQIFPTWFIVYYSGILARRDILRVTSVQALCMVLLSFYLMMLESMYIHEDMDISSLAVSQIKYSSFLFSISLCLLFLSLHQSVKRNILVILGEMSFGIYLLHIPLKKGIDAALNHIVPVDAPLWQMLDVLATLTMCMVVLKVAYRLFPEKLNRYLGLR